MLWRALFVLIAPILTPPLGALIRTFAHSPLLWLERALYFVVGLALTWTTILLAAWWIDRRPVRDYALEPTRKQLGDLVAGLLLGSILMGVIFAILWAMNWLEIDARFFVNIPGLPFAVAILGPVLAFVAIAVGEEVIFRGYILRNCAEGSNFGRGSPHQAARRAIAIAWMLSSVLFGLFHVFNPNSTWASTINLILVGMMFGLPVILTGRLGFAIGLHFAWNFAQGTLFGFPVSGNDFEGVELLVTRLTGPTIWTGGRFGPEAGLLGMVTSVAGCLIILLWAARREGPLHLNVQLTRYVTSASSTDSPASMESVSSITSSSKE